MTRCTVCIASALLATLLAAAATALAQGDAAKAAAVRRASNTSDLVVVGPQGKVTKAPDKTTVKLQTEVLSKPQDAGDLLRRNGLVEDKKTLEMLKRMNPGHDFSAGRLPAGTKVDLFVPKFDEASKGLDADTQRVSFGSTQPAKLAVRDQAARVDRVKSAAYRLPASAFQTEKDLTAQRDAVVRIGNAAAVFQKKADTLSPADFAVAKYQIDYASRLAAQVNEKALATGKVSSADVMLATNAAAPTQPMTLRLMSGQTPLPLRRVKVSVLKQDTSEDVRGLQVYVLPAGIIDSPELFDDDEVLTYLTRFSFQDETSPSIANVALFDARVWVGPKLRFTEMTTLIKGGKIKKFQAINDPGLVSPTVDLVFRTPADIVAP